MSLDEIDFEDPHCKAQASVGKEVLQELRAEG